MAAPLTRRRALLAGGVGLAALAGGGTWLGVRGAGATANWSGPSGSPSPSPSLSSSALAAQGARAPGHPAVQPPRKVVLNSELVRINAAGWHSWAMMDRSTGTIIGSKNFAETNMTASMIKAWLAADYLRRAAASGVTPSSSRMNSIRSMIRDSANGPASELYNELGKSATIGRLISICRLTDSRAGDGWSTTRLSARDTCRIANCIGNGTAAGPKWTSWLVGEMRAVRGAGTFGIRQAFPAAEQSRIAIKNGWVDRQATREWNINCMALADRWTMAVLTRYSLNLSQGHGASIAKSVAAQLRANTILV